MSKSKRNDQLIAKTLVGLGIRLVYGLVGVPVVQLAEELVKEGIQFVGFRHEASAAYAACAHGYFTATPGVCLVVGGPGVINALTGVYNAKINNWPMILLGGAMSPNQVGWGAFQELDQMNLMKDAVKYAAQPRNGEQIPHLLEKAYFMAIQGRPGPCYIELTEDLLLQSSSSTASYPPPPIPTYYQADPVMVKKAALLLQTAKAPLIIIGKGCAYSRAETYVLRLVELLQVPFLPTPMGKGVIDDSHELCVSAARSLALKSADCILLLGARLNWMLHFGLSPKYRSGVKFIQVDIEPLEINGRAVKVDVGLIGHLPLVIDQLCSASSLAHGGRDFSQFLSKAKKSLPSPPPLANQLTLSYADVYHVLKSHLSSHTPSSSYVMVTEGANTMDMTRPFFEFHQPRQRIDAGTFATMGVGMGYIISAKLCHPNQWVVGILGDSAFGFSALDLETAVRLRLRKVVLVVMDNHGIYHGLTNQEFQNTSPLNLPPTSLSSSTRYDLLAKGLGANGWLCDNLEHLRSVLEEIWSKEDGDKPALIQVKINPMERKKFELNWQTPHSKL